MPIIDVIISSHYDYIMVGKMVTVDEAYIHCSRHIPYLQKVEGFNENKATGNFFINKENKEKKHREKRNTNAFGRSRMA